MQDINSKDALLMLDDDIHPEDMAAYGDEVTHIAIKHINSTPELYKFIKGNKEYGMSIKDSATTWASSHDDEFGSLFITELDSVDWSEVELRV